MALSDTQDGLAPVLIIGIGNLSRGDDALGPRLLDTLQQDAQQRGVDQDFEWFDVYQLQIENVLDLQARQCVVFLDASVALTEPYSFRQIYPTDQPQLYSHALSPETLLAVMKKTTGTLPPAAYLLCVKGEQFELGEALSVGASSSLDAATQFARNVFFDAELLDWSGFVTA